MILLTRLNGSDLWLNPLQIESIERTPDTIVTMSNGHKYVVRETPEHVSDQVVGFLQQVGLIAAPRQKGENT